MKYAYLYIPGIVILLFSLTGAIIRGRSEDRRQKLRAYYAVANRCCRVLDMKTADPVYRYMQEYAAAYRTVESLLKEKERDHHKADIQELEEYLSDLEQEHWRKRAQPHLQSFFDCYYSLEHESFTPQKAQAIKRKCIQEWQAYCGTPLDKYFTRITPKKFFRSYLGADYDECMDDHSRLERQLDRFIRNNRA